MNSNLKQSKPGRVLQSTQRADYKPFTEASLQLYQFRCQPQKKPTPPTPPPKVDEDTWAKYRKYCYRTTNSVYGSSSFTQKGKSLVVSVLEKDRKEQQTLSAANAKPSATPPRAGCQDTTVPPAEGSKSTAWTSSSSSSGTGPTNNLSSASSASASALTPTTSLAQQPHTCAGPAAACPTRSDIKEAWSAAAAAPAKEAAPVAKETAKATDKLPQIGSGEGGVAQLQEQTDRPKTGALPRTYEDFLSDMCHSVRLERLLNQRFASQTATVLKGSQPEHTTSYRESFHNLQQDKKPLKAVTVKLPKPERKQRNLYYVSEYADKFGFLQRTFPPSMSLNTAPVKVARPQLAIQRTAPSAQWFLCSEYMASFRNPSTVVRPKTC
ncbi:uncharacterized protein LOC134060235 [Sardina pilchardus]|uniref:uncharacterized protein LOC134060235 n=1 Tax=Sardina pilchardus TaxID=27697 RepID=UPI002E0F73FC